MGLVVMKGEGEKEGTSRVLNGKGERKWDLW